MMVEPPRISDVDATPMEFALLREGRAYEAPKQARAHTLSALGVAASGSLLAGTVAWFASKSLGGKAAILLSSLTIVSAVPLAYVLRDGDPVVAPSPSVASLAVPVSDFVPLANAPLDLDTTAPSVPGIAPRPHGPAKSTGLASSDLRGELMALDAARSLLAGGDAKGALRSVTAYFRTFPHGRLRLEAEVLRIDALAKSGQHVSAKRFAREFIKRNPNSVLSDRVRALAVP